MAIFRVSIEYVADVTVPRPVTISRNALHSAAIPNDRSN